MPQHCYGRNEIIFSIPAHEVVRNNENNLMTRGKAIKIRIASRGGNKFYGKIVELVPPEKTVELRAQLLSKGRPSPRALRAMDEQSSLPRRLLGLGLATLCGTIFVLQRIRKQGGWKWYSLSRFLFGIGGKWRVPHNVLDELPEHFWRSGQVRPPSNKQLFWLVGTMTVDVKDGHVYGEDIFDFHPQIGQGVQAQACQNPKYWAQYAFSGGTGDPTQIIIPNALVQWMRKVLGWTKLGSFFVRFEEHGPKTSRMLFSNALWNALGGKPFISVVDYQIRHTKEEE
jgi:hypothetical protein